MTNKIIDQYTDLQLSRQRKYQLRHPERHKAAERRYRLSEAGKQARSEINRRYREKAVDKKTLTISTDLLILKHNQFVID
jgi:hypothetical protein